jgi:hypothetical protein
LSDLGEPGNEVSTLVLCPALARIPTPQHRKNANKVVKKYRSGTSWVYNLLIPL